MSIFSFSSIITKIFPHGSSSSGRSSAGGSGQQVASAGGQTVDGEAVLSGRKANAGQKLDLDNVIGSVTGSGQGSSSSTSPMAKALYAVDEMSGFVTACALVRPTGIEGMKAKSVRKKMKQPSFAAAVDRDQLRRAAEELGVDLDEHIGVVISALAANAEALALGPREDPGGAE